ncbi:unnamed protein product [Amoebophrya sp. A120]|nr:unnamed protein product [Amoebophrya sp. A120]|eukprot:GSA120T00007129001.1
METRYTFRNDLLEAEKVYNPEAPCMTHSIQMIGWLQLKMRKKCAAQIEKSFENAYGPFRVWTEYPRGGATNFITGTGGFLQTVSFGLGGLRIRENGLLLEPGLVRNMKRVVLRGIFFLKCRWRIEFSDAEFFITVMECGADQDQAVIPSDADFYSTNDRAKTSTPLGLVARWNEMESNSNTDEASGSPRRVKIYQKQHFFELRRDLRLNNFPNENQRRNYRQVLLQHEQDAPAWPDVGGIAEKKICTLEEIDTDYFGGDMGIWETAATAEECRQICEQNAECELFTFLRGQVRNNCLFKRGLGAEKRYNSDTASGRCVFEKVDYELVQEPPAAAEGFSPSSASSNGNNVPGLEASAAGFLEKRKMEVDRVVENTGERMASQSGDDDEKRKEIGLAEDAIKLEDGNSAHVEEKRNQSEQDRMLPAVGAARRIKSRPPLNNLPSAVQVADMTAPSYQAEI